MIDRTRKNISQNITAILICLLSMSGCAGMKNIVYDTHETLITITTLTELEEVEGADKLYDVQEQIIESCKPMLDCTRIKFEGEEIPLFNMLDFLFSYDTCRKTLDVAQQGLTLLENTRDSQ